MLLSTSSASFKFFLLSYITILIPYRLDKIIMQNPVSLWWDGVLWLIDQQRWLMDSCRHHSWYCVIVSVNIWGCSEVWMLLEFIKKRFVFLSLSEEAPDLHPARSSFSLCTAEPSWLSFLRLQNQFKLVRQW